MALISEMTGSEPHEEDIIAITGSLVKILLKVIAVLAIPSQFNPNPSKDFLVTLRETLEKALNLRKTLLSIPISEYTENKLFENTNLSSYIDFMTLFMNLDKNTLMNEYLIDEMIAPSVLISSTIPLNEIPDSHLPLAYAWTCMECIIPILAVPDQQYIPNIDLKENNGDKKTSKSYKEKPHVLNDDLILGVKDLSNCRTLLEIIFVFCIISTKEMNANSILLDAFLSSTLSFSKIDLQTYSSTSITTYYVTKTFVRFLIYYNKKSENVGYRLLIHKYLDFIILPLIQISYDPDWLEKASLNLNQNNKILHDQFDFWNKIFKNHSSNEITSGMYTEIRQNFEFLFVNIKTKLLLDTFIALLPVGRKGAIKFDILKKSPDFKSKVNFFWLSRCLGNFLTMMIMRPDDGIESVIKSFQDRLDEEKNELLIQDSISKVLLSVPASHKKDDYYSYVANELYKILNGYESQIQGTASFAFRSCIYLSQQLLKRDKNIAEKLIYKPILRPLFEFWTENQIISVEQKERLDLDKRIIISSEEEIEHTIEFLIYSVGIIEPRPEGGAYLWDIYLVYIPILFVIAFNRINRHLNSKINDVLISFFKTNFESVQNAITDKNIAVDSDDEDVNPNMNLANNLILGVFHNIYESAVLEKHCLIKAGESGRIQFVKHLDNNKDDLLLLSTPSIPTEDLIDFFIKLKIENFMSLLFLDIFEYQSVCDSSRSSIYLNHLLLILLSKFDDPRKLLHDPTAIIRFSNAVLVNNDNIEMVELALTLLSSIFCGEQLDGKDDDSDDESDDEDKFSKDETLDHIDLSDPMFKSKAYSRNDIKRKEDETILSLISVQQLDELLVILTTLSNGKNEGVKEMAKDIKLKITSMRIEINGCKDKDNKEEEYLQREKSRKKLRNALKDFRSEMIPVRAYGVSIVRQFIYSKDPIIEGELNNITLACLDLMRDKDSFVYLNVIKTLASLTDIYPQATLTLIVTQYRLESHGLDYRLQIGEALLRTIQRCGEVFPKYSDRILPTILSTLLDADKNLKSSAMSLISCIAENAPLSLLPFLNQLLSYLSNIVQVDYNVVETKRGAIHTLFQVLDNVGDKGSELIPIETLIQIQKILIGLESNVREDFLVRSHAKKTLEIINYWLPITAI